MVLDVLDGLMRHGRRGRQDPDRDRQIEPRASLAQAGRSEVHGDAPLREALTDGADRSANSRRALANCCLGQADDVDSWKHRTDSDFDLDPHSVDPGEGSSMNA